jgi:chorismate mutase
VPVRAVRAAVQLATDSAEDMESRIGALVAEVLVANELGPDDVVSVIFTATDDLTTEFPASAARRAGLGTVPMLCARELSIGGAMPRVIRALFHVESSRRPSDIRHIYLGGAAELRPDLAHVTTGEIPQIP